MATDTANLVRQAGVVGAGGAGFPTHVKLESTVDTYIVNGAECEPLLYKDKELMRLHAEPLVIGLRKSMEATGAKTGILAVKGKYKHALEALTPFAVGGITIAELGNYYPAGDEVDVVFETTGRLIPPGGIPLKVGCVVNNVETLINVAWAVDGKPVTHKWITVAGAVKTPSSFLVPVGITINEAIELAGGATTEEPAVVDGGPMMGPAVLDLSQPVTKVTGGYVVLPASHKLIQRKTLSESTQKRIAQSACDQCTFCTELCPRYLLGYAVEPHKVMRATGFAGEQMESWSRFGLLCCECSLCSLYACPEDLPPREMCVRSKGVWAKKGWPEPLAGLGRPHPMRESRKVPIPRLMHRLGLSRWDAPAPMVDCDYHPRQIRLLLKQHLGAPSEPVVSNGDSVHVGQLVAAIPEGKLGANIHSSIAGHVKRVTDDSIWISTER